MDWDQYFFDMIGCIREKSKDRSTKVGAVIVGEHRNVLSTGFNGFPRGVSENEEEMLRSTSEVRQLTTDINEEIDKRHSRPDKYLWTEHAERNAIYNAARHGVALDGSIIYVDWIPCARCARAIIQSGISKVIIDARDREAKEAYWNERWADDMTISKQMLSEAQVDLIYFGE